MVSGFTIAGIISLLFGSGILVTVFQYIHKKIRQNDEKTEAVCCGVQALLRDRLYEQYDKYYNEKGYAPIWVKNNFENMYNRYDALGENGVMEKHYIDFKNLPDKLKEEE